MRTATDVKHVVVAAATRNSAPRAEQFLKDVGAPATARGYGSYRALVADADVEAVYVGTPHSHHYQHARLALEAGKHVLCEKAFTTCAAQAEELVKIAREKGLFLMEAVWTRYFPDFRMLSDRVRNGDIGDVARVTADLSFYHDIDGGGLSTNHRLLNQNLAGGALLDCKCTPFFP
jgi:predicted dehydrogenase